MIYYWNLKNYLLPDGPDAKQIAETSIVKTTA